MIVAATAALALAINAPTRTPRLKNSVVAGEVYDLDSHRVLYARNGGTLMVAASTTKLLTEGTSLALLGPDFRWTTPVYRTGSIDAQGVLHGDLVLVASGDPNLSQRIQPDGTLAFENEDHAYDGSRGDEGRARRSARGITRSRCAGLESRSQGGRRKRHRRFVALSRSGRGGRYRRHRLADRRQRQRRGRHGNPRRAPGDPVSIAVSPQTPYVQFVNQATTGAEKSDATIDMSNDLHSPDATHRVIVTGSQPAGPSVLYAYRVPEPKIFAEQAFRTALADAGIKLNAPSAGTAVAGCVLHAGKSRRATRFPAALGGRVRHAEGQR